MDKSLDKTTTTPKGKLVAVVASGDSADNGDWSMIGHHS